jgi:hypothetical protein
LKTADQAGLDEKDNVKVVTGFIASLATNISN